MSHQPSRIFLIVSLLAWPTLVSARLPQTAAATTPRCSASRYDGETTGAEGNNHQRSSAETRDTRCCHSGCNGRGRDSRSDLSREAGYACSRARSRDDTKNRDRRGNFCGEWRCVIRETGERKFGVSNTFDSFRNRQFGRLRRRKRHSFFGRRELCVQPQSPQERQAQRARRRHRGPRRGQAEEGRLRFRATLLRRYFRAFSARAVRARAEVQDLAEPARTLRRNQRAAQEAVQRAVQRAWKARWLRDAANHHDYKSFRQQAESGHSVETEWSWSGSFGCESCRRG